MSYSKVVLGDISFWTKSDPTVASSFAPGSNRFVRIPQHAALLLIGSSGWPDALLASFTSSFVTVPRLSTLPKMIASLPSNANFSN